MSETEFWRMIALIDVAALDEGDEESAIEPLHQALLKKPERELFAFEEQLAQCLYAIDGEVFADNAGESGGSDDGFLYARCYVVAKGRRYYDSVRSDPANMPKSIGQWCEALLHAHREAWAVLHRTDASAWPYSATVSYETASNPALWDKQ